MDNSNTPLPKSLPDRLEQMIEESKIKKAKRLEAAGDLSDGGILANKDATMWMMVLPEITEGRAKWRTQSFGEMGFTGHLVFNSMHEAKEEAVRMGFYQRDDEALSRLQDTPKFQRGNFLLDLVARINSGTLTHAEGDRLIADYDSKITSVADPAEPQEQIIVTPTKKSRRPTP
jgi:hypothetical protein